MRGSFPPSMGAKLGQLLDNWLALCPYWGDRGASFGNLDSRSPRRDPPGLASLDP